MDNSNKKAFKELIKTGRYEEAGKLLADGRRSEKSHSETPQPKPEMTLREGVRYLFDGKLL